MAAAKKVVSVDFGSSTLKVGIFQSDPVNGLSLLDYELLDLKIEPGKDEHRLGEMLNGLQSVVQQKKLEGLPAICSLSGQFAFTRFVKLPPVTADQVEQMIGFEAQQNVPFPIQEVIWDYQLLGGRTGTDFEAVIVAVKDDLIEQAAAALNASKLKFFKMDVSPLALINSYFYNVPSGTSCTLLVDIGSKCTNLIFVDGTKIFARVIPIGGHMITQNIANEFQEPYKSAELLKMGKGFVGLGGAYADPEDQAAARISKISRSVFSRLHAEVSRSISFYRNQQGGKPPERILLAGGGARMAYADLFFKEKLNLPVEHFNPLRNVAIGAGVDRNRLSLEAPLMGELVGAGLRFAGDTPVEINLTPQSITKQKQKSAQMPTLAATLLVFCLAFLVSVGVNLLQLSQVRSQIETLQADLNEKNSLAVQIEKNRKEFNDLALKADTLLRLRQQEDFWPHFLNVFIQSVQGSVGLWVTEMKITANGAPLTMVPQSAPTAGAAARPPRPRPGAAAVAPVETAAKPVNLAPYGTELNLRGFFESDLGYDFINAFVQKLSATGMFEEVKILERDNLEDQVALKFYIQAKFKEETRPVLLP
ncbi:MAG: type IV pilus assembly protein PilM [Candidatus Methylacidiphilales bacterium]